MLTPTYLFVSYLTNKYQWIQEKSHFFVTCSTIEYQSRFYLLTYVRISVSWEAGSAFRPGNNQSVIILEAFEGWNPFPDETLTNSYNKSSVCNPPSHAKHIFALINAFLVAK